MTLRRHVACASLLAALCCSFVLAQPQASAHTWQEWMPRWWPSNNRTVSWRFHQRFPQGDGWRNRVKDGMQAWNNLGQTLQYQFSTVGDVATGSSEEFNWCTAGYPVTSQVDYLDFDPVGTGHVAGYGLTSICSEWKAGKSVYQMYVAGFRIRLDSYSPDWSGWYTGASTSIPAGYVDVQGIIAHEMGHVSGRCCFTEHGMPAPAGGDTAGHFLNDQTDPASLCRYGWDGSGAATRQTMCGGTSPAASVYWRTLETHDKDMFQAAY